MANQTKKSEWVKSIYTFVQTVDHDYIQSCSISVVPEGLKKANEDAYIPKKVSIGPRFNGSREVLLLMEDVKLSCMMSLIHRAGKDGEAAKNLEQCSEAVWELDEKVRASYLGGIKLEQQELAKIMLLDGCFLLELLITKGLDDELPSRLRPPCPAAEVLKDDDVVSDLMLLENQIPILVLHELFQTLFPNVFKLDMEKQKQIMEDKDLSHYHKRNRIEGLEKKLRANEINHLALSVLGYSPLQLPSFQSPHFLDVVHVSAAQLLAMQAMLNFVFLISEN